jgi:hypothetical protein
MPEIVFLTIMRYIFAPRGYANAALAAGGVGPAEWLVPGHLLAWLTVVAGCHRSHRIQTQPDGFETMFHVFVPDVHQIA